MVTSRDIAQASGVSQSTVSRVIRNRPNVSTETRERVQRVLEQMNYAPDGLARAMIMKRTGNVGVVVDDISNPFYPQVVEAFGRGLEELGLRMMLWNSVAAGERGAIDTILQRLIDGVIFTTATPRSASLLKAVQLGVPLVLFNRYVDGLDCDQVTSDNERGGQDVAHYFVDHGHERVAFMAGPEDASTSADRESGFRRVLKKRGVSLPDAYRVVGRFTEADSHRAMAQLMRLPEPPTAVFCANDLMAFGALNAARSVGCRVPEDVWVVGFDDIQMASWKTFDLTTVQQPINEMVSGCLTLLTARMEDKARPVQRIRVKGDSGLIVRGTTAHAPLRTRKGKSR